MEWTKQNLMQIEVPEGKKKLLLTDPETRGLVLEVRQGSRSFFLRYTFEGKQRMLALGHFPTLSIADARRRADDFKRRVFMGEDPLEKKATKRDCPTVDAFFTEYYQPFSKTHHKRAQEVTNIYRNHIRKRFGPKRMNEVTRIMVRQWTNHLIAEGYAPGMINRLLVLLGQLYTVATDLGIKDVPRREDLGIKYLKNPAQHQRYISNDEAARLADAVRNSPNKMLRYLVGFILMTGARKREALDARWEHVNFEQGLWLIPVSKTGAPRHIYLSRAAIDLLRARQQAPFHDPSNPLIFPNLRTGRAYKCFFTSWNSAREEAGLPDLRVHDLRHSFASVLVNNGVSIYDVQKLLGHSSIRTTQRYAHLSSATLFRSVAVADRTYGVALGLEDHEAQRQTPSLPDAD